MDNRLRPPPTLEIIGQGTPTHWGTLPCILFPHRGLGIVRGKNDTTRMTSRGIYPELWKFLPIHSVEGLRHEDSERLFMIAIPPGPNEWKWVCLNKIKTSTYLLYRHGQNFIIQYLISL